MIKPRRYFWVVLLAFFVACQNQTVSEVSTSTPTATAPTLQPPNALPTETPPSPTPLPPFPLDGYVIVFTKDDDLYFQDGNSLPIQLTHGEEESHSPILSDDDKKIVFYRGETFDNLYSVNTDGSEEGTLIAEQWLATFGEGASVRFPTFIPNTHQLLFNTYLCETQEYNSSCLIGLFLADTDTGVIKEILPPKNFDQYDHDGNFKISPDGKMVSVVMSGHIDVFGMDGKPIRQNVLSYTPSKPSELFPSQYWLPDSSGLIVAIPDAINFGWAYPINPTYSVWLYKINSDVAEQILLDPSPVFIFEACGDAIKVSPDGNWILYGGIETNKTSLYIGNLINGQIQLYAPYPCPWRSTSSWSPDSKYFVYGDYFIGATDKPSIPIGLIGSSFVKWIDSNRYIYVYVEGNSPKANIGELVGETVKAYAFESFWLIKTKR